MKIISCPFYANLGSCLSLSLSYSILAISYVVVSPSHHLVALMNAIVIKPVTLLKIVVVMLLIIVIILLLLPLLQCHLLQIIDLV